MNEFSLLPPVLSDAAARTDVIYFGLLATAGLIVVLVTTLIVVFSVRYREGSSAPRHNLPGFLARDIEIGWTLATLFTFLLIFGWAAAQDFQILRASPGAMTIQILGKQWMWKVEHPGGQREINALHVPVDTPVRLILDSQDVIHSFYVPALRLKNDVVPGLTQSVSFTASRTGTYPIECAEFCGNGHSRMLGAFTVLSRADYARWLSAQPEGDTLALAGARLFRSYGCSGCHLGRGPVRAPDLSGIYGQPVSLADGRVVIADEAYIRDSILQPRKDVVVGFNPVMPSFAGRVSQSDLVELIAYIRSLTTQSQNLQGADR